MNAFANVRLAPLQNLRINDVMSAKDEGDQHTITIIGKHKTGRKCILTLPNELFEELKEFSERLILEQEANNETQVLSLYFLC